MIPFCSHMIYKPNQLICIAFLHICIKQNLTNVLYLFIIIIYIYNRKSKKYQKQSVENPINEPN